MRPERMHGAEIVKVAARDDITALAAQFGSVPAVVALVPEPEGD